MTSIAAANAQLDAFMRAGTSYEVWVHDNSGWTRLDATLGQTATRDGCIALAIDSDGISDRIRVIKHQLTLAPIDITEEIAWAITERMARSGTEADTILRFRIVSAHLTNAEVDGLCKHHGYGVAAE